MNFYQKKYKNNWNISHGDEIRLEKISKLVRDNLTVLDVGCKNGIFSEKLKNSNNIIIGIDISLNPLYSAKNKLFGVCWSMGESLPFKDGSFDLIVAGEIIEHTFNVNELLHEIHRVLKYNGELIISTPNFASLGRRLKLLMGKNPYLEIFNSEDLKNAGHVNYFVKDSLFEILEQNNFKIICFTSDVINFSSSGKLNSRLLANLMPTFGKSLIVKAIIYE